MSVSKPNLSPKLTSNATLISLLIALLAMCANVAQAAPLDADKDVKDNPEISQKVGAYATDFFLSSLGMMIEPPIEEDVVNIYNWESYIPDNVISEFERNSGTQVNYGLIAGYEIMSTMLLTGGSGYDVVFPNSAHIPIHPKAGIFQEIDYAKLPNFTKIDAFHKQKSDMFSSGNKFMVPYMWGTTGYGYNVKKIEQKIGEDAPLDSWAIIFEAVYAEKLADCGMSFLNSSKDVFNMIFYYLSFPPGSEDESNYNQALDKLISIRPYIKYFSDDFLYADIASEDICIGLGKSGLFSHVQFMTQQTDVAIEYVIPKEGADIWYDLIAIPIDAPNPDAAHQFINHLLLPKNMAKVSRATWYPNTMMESKGFMEGYFVNNPLVYPPEYSMLFDLKMITVDSPKAARLRNRTWVKFKTGV